MGIRQVEGEHVMGKDLAKVVKVVSECLWQDCPGQLLGLASVRVCQVKAEWLWSDVRE